MARASKISLIALGVLLSPVILFCLTALLLYFPPFQNWAVKLAADYASEKNGMEISIQHIHLAFPIDLKVDGVKILQPNDSLPGVKDTVANITTTIVKLQMKPLFKGDLEVDDLHLRKFDFNTTHFISDCRVKGRADELFIRSHGISLPKEKILVNEAMLNGAVVDVLLSDTARKDTSKTENKWKIEVQKLRIHNTDVTVHMPGDSLIVGGRLGNAELNGADINLFTQKYNFKRVQIAKAEFRLKNRGRQIQNELYDFNNIRLHKLGLLATDLRIDTLSARAKTLGLTTEFSRLFTENAYFPYNAFEENNPGSMNIKAIVHIGMGDMKTFCPTLPASYSRFIPWGGIDARADFQGNLKKFILDADAETFTPHYTKLRLWVTGYRLRLFNFNTSLTYGTGRLWLNGSIDAEKVAYDAKLRTERFPLQYFVSGLSPISAKISASGKGLDIFSRKTRLKADASLQSFFYSRFNLSGSTIKADIKDGRIHTLMHCHSRMVEADAKADALMNIKNIKASLNLHLRKADLYALHIADTPLTTSMQVKVDFATNLKDHYEARGSVTDVRITDTTRTFHPEDLLFNVFTNRDTTYANASSGSLALQLNARGGYKRLLKVGDRLTAEVKRQVNNMSISADSLKMVLPYAHLQIYSENHNFFARYLQRLGVNFKDVQADITSSPHEGINGYLHIDSLLAMEKQIDMISLNIRTDSTGIRYNGQIQNYPGNPQYAFNALFDGQMLEHGSDVHLKLFDEDNLLGINMGLNASIVNAHSSRAFRLTLSPDSLILGYQPFTVNKDNFLMLSKGNRLWANLKLQNRQGTGIQLRTKDVIFDDDSEDEGLLQDATLSIVNLNLHNLSAALPYIPDMSGTLNSDFHVVQTKDNLTVSSSAGIQDFKYDGVSLGNLSTEFIYSPRLDGSHTVNGILSHNDDEVGEFSGIYTPSGVNADFTMDRLPLNIVNAFIPDQVMGLGGYGNGKISIDGPLDKLSIQGLVQTDSAHIVSVPYGIDLALEDTELKIENNRVDIDEAKLITHNKKPINLKGYVDFTDISNMFMDVRAGGKNVLLVDSKQTRRSEVWGKAYADIFARVSGRMDNLQIKGMLNVLGTSDMTYLLKDSPLTTDNALEGMVEFVDFNGKEEDLKVHKVKSSSVDMDLTVEIEPNTHVFCALNSTRSNYVDITGSGTLRMGYHFGELSLKGRYEISSGEMKYSLPVIPLRTFNIKSGSFVEFKGDVTNPTLIITALENVRTTVSERGSNSRTVLFNCGVKLSKTLQDLGLEFIIEAPEDQNLQSQLQLKSVEDRAKLAVTMLTTGLYYDETTTGSLSTSTALSSFLSSQIGNITGTALKTLDLSVGLNNSIDAQTGGTTTDYSFKFAKRFLDNRLKVSIGGKVSSGANAAKKNSNFLDNVSVEYRITQKSDLNLKAFYERQVYDYLEGYVDKYGVGIIWKKQVPHFLDFFRPSTYKSNNSAQPSKSEKNK